MVSPHGGELGVGFGHECLQLFFKELVSGLGSGGLDRSALGTGLILILVPQKDYESQAQLLRQQVVSWVQQIPRQLNSGLCALSDSIEATRESTVSLSKLGNARLSTGQVMTVTAQHSGILYLRGQDYDHYTGTGWVSTTQRSEVLPAAQRANSTVTIHTRRIQDILYIPCDCAQAFLLSGGRVPNSQKLRQYQIATGSGKGFRHFRRVVVVDRHLGVVALKEAYRLAFI